MALTIKQCVEELNKLGAVHARASSPAYHSWQWWWWWRGHSMTPMECNLIWLSGLSPGSHQCSALLQHNFKATDQCDFDVPFHCCLQTSFNRSQCKLQWNRKKVVQEPFSKSLRLEVQRFERFHCRQWGTTWRDFKLSNRMVNHTGVNQG